MRKIFITGSKGQLGIALNKQLENKNNIQVINTDVADLDITNLDSVMSLIKEVKPEVIINCAAHTAVDECEDDVDNAYKINAIGPRNLSIASNEVGAKIIQISTDYVFDGNTTNSYNEFDKVNPVSVYGKSKLEGENFVKSFTNRYFIIRTAWLYGEGKNFVKTMLNLSETRPVINVVNDQFGTPTSTKELAKVIEYLMDTDNFGTFHGTCEGVTNWYEFTKEIFKLKNISTEVLEVTSDKYPTKAKRPAYSVLDNYMLRLTSNVKMAEWENALADYLL